MIKETLMQRIQSLTSEDMQVLDDVLTPSVSNVLNKIVPEIEPLLTQFTLNDDRQEPAVNPQPPAVNPQPPQPRVGFKYGSDRYGQSKKVSSAMNVDYNDPFKKLMSNDSGRFIKSTSSLARYAKNLNALKNSKQAKAALRKSLLVENEKTRKEALKRLTLLKKLYSGGKSV